MFHLSWGFPVSNYQVACSLTNTLGGGWWQGAEGMGEALDPALIPPPVCTFVGGAVTPLWVSATCVGLGFDLRLTNLSP